MQKVSILPLGAGCQVGRSCLILTVNNKKIMLDCGLMINKGGRDALPLFDKIKPQELSLILITHAHLDHCGALPYFLANFNFKKKIYMTKPTKDIYHYLVKDTLKVRNQQALFNQQQIRDSMQQVSTIDFGIEIQQQGIKVTAYVAGHIVGAAMFIIQIDGVKILYTGDYSCEQDRYIMKAQIPQSNVDILIAQSTFGIRVHQNRAMRERMFQLQVKKIVTNGGKCLLPVFSAGRAQQLLFILDEFWQKQKGELGHIHIYYTVSLIEKCKDIYETYIDMLSEKIKQRFYKEVNNPFKYRYIHYLKSNQRIYQEELNPMVVMCTPGMLQSGQSRTLLQRWCHDSRNGVIITGYCAQGSIANNLKKGDSICTMNENKPISVNLNVSQISFAAHADCQQTSQFIKKVKPAHVVLVHGSAKNAQNLKEHLQKEFKQIQSVSCPINEQQLPFQISITQKYQITGKLKQKIQELSQRKHHLNVNTSQNLISIVQQQKNKNQNNMQIEHQQTKHKELKLQQNQFNNLKVKQKRQINMKMQLQGQKQQTDKNNNNKQVYQFQGYIVQNGQQKVLVEQSDKNQFFPHLKGIEIRQKITVNYIGGLTMAQVLARQIFRQSKITFINGKDVLIIKSCLYVTILVEGKTALVEYISNKKADIMADQFCFLLQNILYDPFSQSAMVEEYPICPQHKKILNVIAKEYSQTVLKEGVLIVINKNGESIATADLFKKTVDCQDQYLKMRLYGLMESFLEEQKEDLL